MEDVARNSVNWDDVAKIISADPQTFDAIYKVRPGETSARIWRDAYGDDYPEEVAPFSFVTKTDLLRIAGLLASGSGKVYVDLGCGRGGPGLWLARETDANLIGVDQSTNAIAQATQRIGEFGLAGRAHFVQADLCTTGLPDQSLDGAISIDVVMFIVDKAAVMREVARILRPGGRFIFTAFEGISTEVYRAPLLENGFSIEVYEEKPDWRRRQLALYQGTLDQQDALITEMGEGAQSLIGEAKFMLADGMATTRHIFVVGRKV
jgi:SAM-dependent methyltransferase